ncbi:DUF3150 domain-containing protein [Solidesulfovibrio alcoholivorans]|uniref:DUF3150 domain-containing protein n=1 Tax=Solidesulfovibrio alcoholivorans TaxID=81406 RepID=UPI0004962575|nr:DUF3150 domain-containing protein [Solidesulfovibrio alcoholivorans]
MDTPVLSDIRVLDNILAVNLNVTLWSARKKLTLEDFGHVDLPPEDLASLGSKRIAPPESLRIFGTLKARAFSFLDRHGIRFLGGWAVPEDKATEIVQELTVIRDDFFAHKEVFLAEYDGLVRDWIAKHADWANILANATVGSDYVRARLGFAWQFYKVAPLMGHPDTETMAASGLYEEVEQLGATLFTEIAKSADETWRKVYAGRTEVTHKALSPLRTMYQKLMGLTFVEPHVAPVAEIVQMALSRLPRKGTITGTDLLMLQGLVCLLRDPDALIEHSQKVIEGYGPATVLDAVLRAPLPEASPDDLGELLDESDEESLERVALPDPGAGARIPSMGLW